MHRQIKALLVILIVCPALFAGHQLAIGASAELFGIRDDQISHVKYSGIRIPMTLIHTYQSPVSYHKGSVVFTFGSDLTHPVLFDSYTVSELELRYCFSRALPVFVTRLDLHAGAAVSAHGYKGIIPYNEHYGAKIALSALLSGSYQLTEKTSLSNETSYEFLALVMRPAYNLYRFYPDQYLGSVHNMICIRNDLELSHEISERYGIMLSYRMNFFSFREHLRIRSGSDGVFLKAAVRF